MVGERSGITDLVGDVSDRADVRGSPHMLDKSSDECGDLSLLLKCAS